MLGEMFYWALNLSILGTIAGIIVMLLRKLKALPRFGAYLLWLLPLYRFWALIGLGYKYSLLSLIPPHITKHVAIWESNKDLFAVNSIQGAANYFPIVYKSAAIKAIFEISGAVWAVVALALALCSAALYFITKSAVKGALLTKDRVHISDKVLTPAVYGIIRPKIILPANGDFKLEYVLMHEKIHIRRHDNLWRAIGVATACVHWFNPFVWVFLKYFFIDMEVACDTGVLKDLDPDQRKPYAMELLKLASGKTYFISAFGGAKTRFRIENILSYKKLTLFSCLFFSIFLILVALTIATNAGG